MHLASQVVARCYDVRLERKQAEQVGALLAKGLAAGTDFPRRCRAPVGQVRRWWLSC
jgi:hypothetical protein